LTRPITAGSAGITPAQKVESIIKETNELIAIFVTIVTKIKARLKKGDK
jgi:hypothetical protein